MNDTLITYILTVICLILIVASFKSRKQFGLINLIVFFLYSLYLYYGLFYKGADGTSIVWWFYLLLLTGLHILIVGIYLLMRFIKFLRLRK